MKIWREVFGWLRTIVITLVLALAINVFLVQPTKVMGLSMTPTLQDKEIIFVSKLSHTLRYEPDYNDIVIIDSRVNRSRSLMDDILENPLINLVTGKSTDHTFWVKRVIGKSGDVLELKDGKVYRNGKQLEEPYIKEAMITQTAEKIVVPKDHVFVMGDNRNNSRDSRYIGSVPLDHVLGEKLF